MKKRKPRKRPPPPPPPVSHREGTVMQRLDRGYRDYLAARAKREGVSIVHLTRALADTLTAGGADK